MVQVFGPESVLQSNCDGLHIHVRAGQRELLHGNGGGGRKDLAQAGGNKPTNVKKIFNEIKNEILKLS